MGTPLPWGQAVDLGWGRGRASAPSAASIRRIDRQLGRPADINEAWRSPEQANANRARWLAYERYLNGGPWAPQAPYALGAEDSVHCTGDAADSDDWYDPYTAAVWRENGWRQTARYPGTARDEPWHGERFPHLDKHAGEPAGEEDMPLSNDDLIAILTAKFDVTQRGVTRKVTLAQALEAVFVVGDILADRIDRVPDQVWGTKLAHTLAVDEKGQPLQLPAGDFLRFEPAEHANTRAAVARVAVGGIDIEKLKREIAEEFPEIDVHALAVAAADEADRRDRARLANTSV
jgi:hypothetical protein